tara:strand:- start:99 stop:305 length:207 start_codon:yes stop_codon:yes gene_type:complete
VRRFQSEGFPFSKAQAGFADCPVRFIQVFVSNEMLAAEDFPPRVDSGFKACVCDQVAIDNWRQLQGQH